VYPRSVPPPSEPGALHVNVICPDAVRAVKSLGADDLIAGVPIPTSPTPVPAAFVALIRTK
jgi:hypothetical protein